MIVFFIVQASQPQLPYKYEMERERETKGREKVYSSGRGLLFKAYISRTQNS